MFDAKRPRWRKLDNAALAFPAATGKKDTRVFRFYCELKETVNPEILQEALDQTMLLFPVFQAVLRKGLFWFYLEHREMRVTVRPETRPPCSRIYVPDQKRLLFEVTYHEERINFEVFHALTDGTGALRFIRELVKHYLILAHKENVLPDIPLEDTAVTETDYEEDSFAQYYSESVPRRTQKKPKAVQLHGPRTETGDMQIMEGIVSVKEILAKAREYGVSVTVLLTAVLLCAVSEELTEHQKRRPVALMIPVNLRNYFPSQSMANFFGWIEPGYLFRPETTFEDVLYHTRDFFQQELSKENMAMRMNELVRLERNPFLRVVPLELKNVFLQAGTSIGGNSITAIFSNISQIKMDEVYEPYIQRFGFLTSTDKLQLCSCSFGDELVLDFTSRMRSTNIQRNFYRILKEQKIEWRKPEKSFPVKEKKEDQAGIRFFQWFTFSCIAVMILCGMLNILLTPWMYWSLFVGGGLACTWVMVSVGFSKRRNLLKNGMWQLVIATVLCLLWDLFTGWHRWSIDYVIPFATIVVLLSMVLMAKVRRMEMSEYLFYIVMAAAYGLIPLILFVTGCVTVRYPSILCAGISLLVLAGLGIFRWKDLGQELHKKFRI